MAREGVPDFKDFDDRLRRLRESAQPQVDEPTEPGKASIGGAGVQVGVELVAGVIGEPSSATGWIGGSIPGRSCFCSSSSSAQRREC